VAVIGLGCGVNDLSALGGEGTYGKERGSVPPPHEPQTPCCGMPVAKLKALDYARRVPAALAISALDPLADGCA